MSTLYEIIGNYRRLEEMLEDGVEDEQMLTDTLEAVEGELEVKLENYCKVIKNLEARSNALKIEAERLTANRKTVDNNIAWLKNSMFNSLKATGKTKSSGELFTVSIQKNGGKAPVILDIEPGDVPDSMMIITKKPDLEAMRRAIANDPDFPLAHFGERGESLRIK